LAKFLSLVLLLGAGGLSLSLLLGLEELAVLVLLLRIEGVGLVGAGVEEILVLSIWIPCLGTLGGVCSPSEAMGTGAGGSSKVGEKETLEGEVDGGGASGGSGAGGGRGAEEAGGRVCL
jgi:hypothetical protein